MRADGPNVSDDLLDNLTILPRIGQYTTAMADLLARRPICGPAILHCQGKVAAIAVNPTAKHLTAAL